MDLRELDSPHVEPTRGSMLFGVERYCEQADPI
jgi:hypothetical protein